MKVIHNTRRKWLALAALACVALAVVAVGSVAIMNNREQPGGMAAWLEDLAEVRGPRDLWAVVSGERSRLRFEVTALRAEWADQLRHVAMQAQAKAQTARGKDWPMFGGTPQRNMVNLTAKGIPTEWSVEEGKLKNIKWVAELGSKAYGGPVVADGKVFVGTNNDTPRDPAAKGKKAIVMCFNEADGKFLWQTAHDIPADEAIKEGLTQGICSTPVVDGKRHYYVTPAAEVVAADNDTGKVVWKFDMMKQFKVVPYHLANCSPVVAGDLVFVVTSNGVNEEGKLVNPKAPSFAAFHKADGKLAWSSDLPGENIVEGQWSNPAVAVVNGKPQVIFPGGDCWLYALEPQSGKLIWKCNCNPQRKKDAIDNYIVSTPVIVDDKCYVGLGVYPEHPQATRSSYFVCVDVTRAGDVSPKSLDAKDPANKGSALVWAFGGLIEPRPKKGRQARFGRTISTAAVHDGLVYIAEESGYLHCLDARTGQRHWEYDFKSAVWGSPYYVDGRVYIGTEDGEVLIFKAGPKMEVLTKNDMGEALHSTPVVADNTLYVATRSKLYAIAGRK
jgi:outer membrane protein assembly factor BamB